MIAITIYAKVQFFKPPSCTYVCVVDMNLSRSNYFKISVVLMHHINPDMILIVVGNLFITSMNVEWTRSSCSRTIVTEDQEPAGG